GAPGAGPGCNPWSVAFALWVGRGEPQPAARSASAARAALAGAFHTLEPVLGERLPRSNGEGVDVLNGRCTQRVLDRAQPDAGLVRLGPAAAEEVRAAHGAERLRAPLVRLVGAQELLALEDRHLVAAQAAVRCPRAARELLARRAVAEGAGLEVVRHFELHSTALAAS